MSKINVWIVLDGLNGLYMPNSVVYFTTKREAMAYMAGEARSLREDGYKVVGSREFGYVYGYADACDPEAYAIELSCEPFDSRNERDQFIRDNEDM